MPNSPPKLGGGFAPVGAVYGRVNKLEAEYIPLLSEEGWLRIHKMSRSILSGADGVVELSASFKSSFFKISSSSTTPPFAF